MNDEQFLVTTPEDIPNAGQSIPESLHIPFLTVYMVLSRTDATLYNAGVETKGAGSRAAVERQSRIVFEDV